MIQSFFSPIDCQIQFQIWIALGVLWPGARAFLKLGEVDKAVELARAGVAESKNGLARIECHRVLAEAAHSLGDMEEAEREFRTAHEEARSAGWRYLALLCARDLKRMVLDRDGRGAEGDAMIDGVCALMGKARGTYAEVLSA